MSIHHKTSIELAYNKARILFEAGCRVSEFGTRRRRSFKTQEIVVKALVRASKELPRNNGLAGTSNVMNACVTPHYICNIIPFPGSPCTDI